MHSGEPAAKRHKKHKKDKNKDREKHEDKMFGNPSGASRLKLILKVGGSSTPEHSDSPGPAMSLNVNVPYDGEDSPHSSLSLYSHKKTKKKEKKKKKDKKHKHHHKDKKRKEKEDVNESSSVSLSMDVDSPSVEIGATPVAPISLLGRRLFADGGGPIDIEDVNASSPASGTLKEQKSCVQRQRLEKQPLQKLFDHLLRALEKKDAQQFFAWPVTDKIAPGYSSIIHKPMDFSTMKSKIDDGEYTNFLDFIEDFKLMCNNAMVYNQPETIYYKAAKKLLQGGLKVLVPEKIRSLLPLIPSIRVLTEETLGFPLFPDPIHQDAADISQSEEENQENFCLDPKESKHYMPPHPNDPPDLCGAFTDDLTTEEVLQQARLAAREAAHRLTSKKPNSKLGFLRQRSDGSTSLAILTPSVGVIPGTQEQPMSLGALSGKITHGSSQLMGHKDDKRNLHRSAKTLYYGPFSSYAPNEDTTFSSLTPTEMELVSSTYGEENAVQYAESMIEFAKGCDYAMHMVDDILNTMTRGEHSRTVNLIEERKRIHEEELKLKREQEEFTAQLEQEWKMVEKVGFGDAYVEPPNARSESIDYESVKTLSDLGIDTGFVDDLRNQIKTSVSIKLEKTAELISDLERVQNKRLSLPLQPNLPYVQQPSDEEVKLADQITENLIDLAKQTSPGNIAAATSLRKAMGVDPSAFPHRSPDVDNIGINSSVPPNAVEADGTADHSIASAEVTIEETPTGEAKVEPNEVLQSGAGVTSTTVIMEEHSSKEIAINAESVQEHEVEMAVLMET